MHGLALLAARRMKEALPVLNRAVQTSTGVLGPSHRLTLENRVLRARALGYTGAIGEASREVDSVTDAMRAAKQPTLYVAVRFQAVMAQLRGEYKTALGLTRESLRLMKEASATGAWRGRALTEAAISQLELNDVEDASRLLVEAFNLLSHPDGRIHPDLADVLVGQGRVKMRQGRFVEALPLLEKADSFWHSFDADNRWAGEAALWLARCQQALKRSALAQQTLRRADSILSRSPLPGDNKLRKTLSYPD